MDIMHVIPITLKRYIAGGLVSILGGSVNLTNIENSLKAILNAIQRPIWHDPRVGTIMVSSPTAANFQANIGTVTTVTTVSTVTNMAQMGGGPLTPFILDRTNWCQNVRARY